MKHTLTLLLAFALLIPAMGQKADKPAGKKKQPPIEESSYRMVFQLTTADTLAHKALMKQIGNITSVAPKTQIEVVCHGPGLQLLQTEKSTVVPKIREYAGKGVVFSACEFSMKERKVSKDEILPEASYVQAGILHIVMRQDQGWYYIKSGF
jgi:uncharacterized protein